MNKATRDWISTVLGILIVVLAIWATLVLVSVARAHCPVGCEPVGPTPVPTASPKPTAVPSPVPTVNAKCPQGATLLDGPLTGGWGILRTSIPQGTTRRFCARFMPPKVEPSFAPSRLRFQWYGHPDQDCAALTMEVQQLSGARIMKRQLVPVPTGNLDYVKRVGREDHPENVAQGDYVITVTGFADRCASYDITWGYQ